MMYALIRRAHDQPCGRCEWAPAGSCLSASLPLPIHLPPEWGGALHAADIASQVVRVHLGGGGAGAEEKLPSVIPRSTSKSPSHYRVPRIVRGGPVTPGDLRTVSHASHAL